MREKTRIDAFIKRIPCGEDDWSTISSLDAVKSMKDRLTLPVHLGSSWDDIFSAYTELIRAVNGVAGRENEMEFIKILAIATGYIALQMHARTAQYEQVRATVFRGIRNCFIQSGSSAEATDKTISDYMNAVRRGARLLDALSKPKVLSKRAFELPLHGMLASPIHLGIWSK